MLQVRQEKLRKYIDKKKIVTIRELRELLPDVSVMTIHRDLKALADAGIIEKVRGGARSVRQEGDPVYDVRMRENTAGKNIIVEKALKLIRPDNSVFLDAGTTNLLLARNIPDINISVVTTSPGIALELCRMSNPIITLCGGTMQRRNQSVSGRNTLEMLRNINIDIAFIGVSGFSVDSGFTCGTEEDVYIKRLVIEKARTGVILCDHTKFRRLMPYTFCDIDGADYLICDRPLPETIRYAIGNGRMKIL